jgi:hypothetical protein
MVSKAIRLSALIFIALLLGSCSQKTATPAIIASPPVNAGQVQTHTPASQASPSPTATASPTPSPTAAPSPTPLFVFELSQYDPDIFQPIDLSHNPPLIARSDETVRLMFDPVNTIYCPELQRYCRLEPVLFYAYGEADTFQSLPLTREIVNEFEFLVARPPATDQAGRSLRYYAEFSVPEAGYTLRYPVAGTIDLFAAQVFIPVELPTQNPVAPGDIVYDFFWGFGPDKVRQASYEGYPTRVGPPAMDVASDGRIALMDPVNERVIIYNPNEGIYSSVPLPFTYKFNGDIAFDQNNRLVVFDWLGEEAEGTIVSIPYCYRLLPDGELDVSTPLYVKSPSHITKQLSVLDYYDARLVAPFNSQGEANSREAQRQKGTWDFPFRFMEGLDPFVAHFADVKEGLAFEVHSVSPLGVITEFAKTPQGYMMTFLIGDQIRAVWIDSHGIVLKDVTLPNGQYSEINFNGQVALAQDGSLYVLTSTERGIEIHFTTAP